MDEFVFQNARTNFRCNNAKRSVFEIAFSLRRATWYHLNNRPRGQPQNMFLPRKNSSPEPAQSAWDGVLRVPFDDKDTAKALGARWDTARRLWVVPPELHARREAFSAWDAAHEAPPRTDPELELKRKNITDDIVSAVCGYSRIRA